MNGYLRSTSSKYITNEEIQALKGLEVTFLIKLGRQREDPLSANLWNLILVNSSQSY